MKIQISRIPKEGMKVEATYEPAELDIIRDDVHPATPVTIAAFVRKEEQELIVEAASRCVLECTCGRCLTCFESVIKKDCLFNYDVSARQVVDITDDVRQEIMLDYPLIPVCDEQCRGLCARCGPNLNESDCSHNNGGEEDEGAA